MKKIGLALSGGGFRATLYHLGLVRFLRDAGILPSVSHITSVSGGSIIAAHLCLNWERYNGSDAQFDEAAGELLAFIRLDVRNRILRRFPLGFAVRWARRLIGLSNRKLTRSGLLEQQYEHFLFGDTSLFQLPENPRLHILATNLSEGRLTSFNREGLWLIRRDGKHGFRIDQMHVGLATVAMAVAASSAFPGFFPPMLLSGDDLGAKSGEFGRQSYTDGGVYDNLGVRMFRFLAGSAGSDERSWDGVLVSDVGKPFTVESVAQESGLFRTAMRASDILMDRVWQLENETFKDTPGFVFARITDIVEPHDDPTAPHPEVQRQLAGVRTDLDRFSPLEITSLIHHGYCVGRQVCRTLPGVFGAQLPANPPWTPSLESGSAPAVSAPASPAPQRKREASAVTKVARTLNASAVRRIWSTLLDYRDWTSYVYVPIILPIMVLAPYLSVKYYERSHQMHQIIQSLAQGSRDLEQMGRLLEAPVSPWTGENAEPLSASGMPDADGFTILQDSRIIDLRRWAPAGKGGDSYLYGYRRMKVRQERENIENNPFRATVLANSPQTRVRFPVQELEPKLYSRSLDPGDKQVHWEVGVDFRKVPAGETVDIVYEHFSPGIFLREGVGSTTMAFTVEKKTLELTRWLLLPRGRAYENFRMVRYQTANPDPVENVKPTTEYLAGDSTILAFKLLAPDAGYTYELTWFYR